MEEEISLKELLEIIWKGKYIIIIITVIVVAITAYMSFFVVKPTYEASTTISVNSVIPQYVSLDPSLNVQNINVSDAQVEITSPQVLQSTINNLKLDPKKYSLDYFKSLIDVKAIQNTNFLTITVREKDPKLAANIANSLAESFKSYVNTSNIDQINKLLTSLDKLIKLQTDKISEATNELNTIDPNNKTKHDESQAKVDALKNTRDTIIGEYNKLDIIKSSDMGQNGILISSKAIVPDTPVSPKKTLNIIIAFILGIMVSIFIVFFKEYWENSTPNKIRATTQSKE